MQPKTNISVNKLWEKWDNSINLLLVKGIENIKTVQRKSYITV